MTRSSNRLVWNSLLALPFALGGVASAQTFVDNTTDIPSGNPGNDSNSENVDFGDVDLDGDWDAVFADGGDGGQDQNRIWINQGPGVGLGTFVDETTARFPAINDQSRDVEFVDFDGDGDLDLYVSNTSSVISQGDRWWKNSGVGSALYVDETAARWVGLGGAGSSVAPSLVLGSGGFIDFSGDGDFGDLDNDGDMDLFHSSYGGFYGGDIPSRVFLNDGLGFFSEFNPSGHQLAGSDVVEGQPGIWCEGVQSSNTASSHGNQCDIASSAADIDLGDVDGDFDIDVLHGALSELPRMFHNRTAENNGVLSFRDVTSASFPPAYSTGNGHYEQEMGDLDGDGDLDILGLNWIGSFSFTEVTLRNTGAGVFDDVTTLASSNPDDEEGDFFDYDNDGDLDVYIANFAGDDRLYRNNNDGGTGFSYSLVGGLPPSSMIGRDADCCDVDGDGDYDVFVANSHGSGRNYYFENQTGGVDVHAPYIPNLEDAQVSPIFGLPTVVRAQVYDNAPYYITWYNTTTLTYWNLGGAQVTVPMASSGGQIFRGEIPGNLAGTILYFVSSTDEYGNTGTSATKQFDVGLSPGSMYCSGDGTAAACPCGNVGATGRGCANSAGVGAFVHSTGSSSLAAADLVLTASGLVPNQPGLYFQADNMVNGGNGTPFGDGLRCIGGNVIRLQVVVANAFGQSSTSIDIGGAGGVSSGDFKQYQLWYRDPLVGPCGTGFNLTNGYQVVWVP